jgi:hypothetical protein
MSPDVEPPVSRHRFRLGINYWPARTAMTWWKSFDAVEVASDFARIAAAGFDSVRLFLTWEDFQPAPDGVSSQMLDRLVTVADRARQAGLLVMPTLFTGHMSGVNWIPPWALGGSDGDDRFRVVAGGKVTAQGLRNWYADPEVTRAQVLLAGEAASALAGHEALWAWDLGNESSNCVLPPSRASAQSWLGRVTIAIRAADPSVLVTIGLHMEDLEEDRLLGPAEAAAACDFLTMHGYPVYARWAEGPTDEHLLPFLAHVTRWLGGGRDVVFSELGLPTYRDTDPAAERAHRESTCALVEEADAALYTDRALTALRAAGCTGAMLWCYADYVPAVWDHPPLDVAVHERSFGLWRSDGSPKPALAAVKALAGSAQTNSPAEHAWLDVDPAAFRASPGTHLPRLYARYRAALAALLLVCALACNGGELATPAQPAATAAMPCDAARLAAFDPGCRVRERRLLAPMRQQLGAETIYVAAVPCADDEDDPTCQKRAEREVAASYPEARVLRSEVGVDRQEVKARYEVDGEMREGRFENLETVASQLAALADDGHRVLLLSTEPVAAPDARRNAVVASVRPGPERGRETLRAALVLEPSDQPVRALIELQARAAQADFVLRSFTARDDGSVEVELGCSRPLDDEHTQK